MSSTDPLSDPTAQASEAATVPLKLKVAVLPVADVDRSKAFYQGLGWRLDADFPISEDYRIVQLTPPGSPASIHFGEGLTTAQPGSIDCLILVVDDIEAARRQLISRGADVSDIWHGKGAGTAEGRIPGLDPYRSWASFTDPDGNRFLLQEITQRLPGRA